MARYVLLEFESNVQADAFVHKTMAREQGGARFKVLGYFAKPRRFCECGYLSDNMQARQVRRGAKYGWMIHTPCGRPRRQASHSPRNLLDPDGTPAAKISAFVSLVGAWAKDRPEMAINRNYPIAVSTKPEDK